MCMLVIRRSPLTGQENEMKMDLTPEQVEAYEMSGMSIQRAFPHLTQAEREFFKTGYTQEDWDKMFPPDKPASVPGT